ncbi:MAG: hypothetical protein LC118_19545 [Dehalococcoidia bacterium]|nr:hypothetical protein [Dehalococcoidia bacterium]
MDVCVLSNDLMFYSAVEGVAGAMGHSARQVEAIDEIGTPALLIVDLGSAELDVAAIATVFDPMRTAVFAPHVKVEAFTGSRAAGIAHVHRRGALAAELPRLLAEYAS